MLSNKTPRLRAVKDQFVVVSGKSLEQLGLDEVGGVGPRPPLGSDLFYVSFAHMGPEGQAGTCSSSQGRNSGASPSMQDISACCLVTFTSESKSWGLSWIRRGQGIHSAS